MAEQIPIYGSVVTVPESRFTKDGDQVVHFRMVQDDRYNANRSGNGPAEFKDREPALFLDVDAWRQEWLAEADVKPGDRIGVRGVIRQEKDYPHPKFDQIKAATGIEVMVKGGVKIEAKEVLVSTLRRVVSTRNPYKDGTMAGRQQQGSGNRQGSQQAQAPAQGAPAQGAPAQQAPAVQGDPWAQQPPQQAPAQGGQQGDPWAQTPQGGQQAPAQSDPWAQHG